MSAKKDYIASPLGHVWRGFTAGQICADIPGRGYMTFESKDAAINWLFVNGHKELARLINKTM